MSRNIRAHYWTFGCVIFFLALVLHPVQVAAQGNLPFGAQCTSDSQCVTGDCDKSDVTDSNGTTLKFCDCDETDSPWFTPDVIFEDTSADCAGHFGGTENAFGGTYSGSADKWECSSGNTQSKNLDFCTYKPTGQELFPVDPTSASVLDILTGGGATQVNDLDELLKQPDTQIGLPGLSFSQLNKDKVYEDDEGNMYLGVPLLAEYIAAAYRYGVVIASIVAILVIILSGIQWMSPGNIFTTGEGDKKQTINRAKKRIIGALSGLLIALASYIILYTINPNLVQFKDLRVLFIPRLQLPDIAENDFEGVEPASIGIVQAAKLKLPTGGIPCDNPDAYGLVKIPKMDGVRYIGRSKRNYLLPEVIEPLREAGKNAAAEGYVIGISTACRPTAAQKALAAKNSAGVKLGTTAKPGKSPHGFGYAVDVHLFKDGKNITGPIVGGASNGKQCWYTEKHPEVLQGLHKISEFFIKAGWVRLTTESWHFEYGTAGKYCRGQCTGYASLCGHNGPGDCQKGVNGCRK